MYILHTSSAFTITHFYINILNTMISTTLVLTGNNVVLPDYNTPRPATLIIDLTSGQIKHVHQGRGSSTVSDHDNSGTQRIDAGDKFILPGLVEYVAKLLT
jgi:imidazolonepropionase-like amidohydrolase